MHLGAVRIMSGLTLLVGLLFYVLAVAGLFSAEPVGPGDVGLVSTAGTIMLLGLVGILLGRAGRQPATA